VGALHVPEPHVIPRKPTLPVPAPLTVTLTVKVLIAKLAVTDSAWVIGTVQLGALPLQPPDQPVKVELGVGAAVSVTDVPWL
jgi:hypothetical protein